MSASNVGSVGIEARREKWGRDAGRSEVDSGVGSRPGVGSRRLGKVNEDTGERNPGQGAVSAPRAAGPFGRTLPQECGDPVQDVLEDRFERVTQPRIRDELGIGEERDGSP